MKKYVAILAVCTTFGLGACSTSSNTNSGNASNTKVDVKKEIMQFYYNLGNTINNKDADLNKYEADAAKDPKVTIPPDEKTKADESAAAVVSTLKNVQIPDSLKGQKADLERAIKDYITSYQIKTDQLKKNEPSLDGANAVFQDGDKQLGKAFQSVKLLPAGLEKQVN